MKINKKFVFILILFLFLIVLTQKSNVPKLDDYKEVDQYTSQRKQMVDTS